ncbi:MAG: hypothetical protein Q8755_03415, partial [Candidatus Phytoplasma australasiaticum]|nr:hypothetical protein [Candidatus Phytoplasma australasiaticum]
MVLMFYNDDTCLSNNSFSKFLTAENPEFTMKKVNTSEQSSSTSTIYHPKENNNDYDTESDNDSEDECFNNDDISRIDLKTIKEINRLKASTTSSSQSSCDTNHTSKCFRCGSNNHVVKNCQ